MTRWAILSACVCCLAVVGAAAHPDDAGPQAAASQYVILDMQAARPGRYFYVVDVAAGGKVAVNQITAVIKPGGGPTDPPRPPDPPDPTADLAKKVASWCQTAVTQGDPQARTTAAGLSVIYQEIGKRLNSGEIKNGEQALVAVRHATTAFLDQSNAAAFWVDFRASLGDELSDLRARGELDYKQAFEDIVMGLNAFAGGQARENLDIGGILQLIMTILQLLKDLGILT